MGRQLVGLIIVYIIVTYHRMKYKCADVLMLDLPVYGLYFSIEGWIYILWIKSSARNLISTFLLLSLSRFLSWLTINRRVYHPPSSHCFGPYMVY